MKEEHHAFAKDILISLKAGTLAVFAGAGMSAPAGFVDWQGLLKEIAAELGGITSEGKNLIMLAQEHVNRTGGRSMVNDAVLNSFEKRTKLTETHQLLTKLNIDTFWTTNYDGLIEEALRQGRRKPDVKHRVNQLTQQLQGRDSIIYKMHGDRLSPNETILTLDDYTQYQDTHGPFLDMLSSDLIRERFLFIGISFEDPNLEWVFSRLREQLGTAQRHHWYFIRRDPQEPEKQEKFAARLKAYSLLPVWIDQFEEIPMILKEIDEALLNNELRPVVKNKNKEEKLRDLGRLTDKYPFHPRLLSMAAFIYLEENEYTPSRKCMEAVLDINPDDYSILSSLGGLVHNRWKDYALAEKYFLRSLAINDQYAQAQTNIGNNYKQLGQFEKAAYHYRCAILLDPQDDSPHNGLAECYEHFGEPEKARDEYLEALKISPNDLVSLNNLAKLTNLHLHDPEKARYYYELALPFAEEEAVVHLNYGYLLMNHFGELSLARSHFEKAGQIDRGNYTAPFFVAMVLEKTKTDKDGVAFRLQEAIRLNPNSAELHLFLGEVKSREGIEQREQTMASFRKAIELEPEDATAWYNLGWVQLFHYQEHAEAAASFEKAIAFGTQEYACYYNLFLICKNYLQQPERAKALLNEMTKLFPDKGVVYLQIGDFAVEDGAYDTAIQHYRRAVTLGEAAQHSGEDHEYLSTAYVQLAGTLSNHTEDQEGARKAAEQSIALNPSDLAYFNYGIILGKLGKKEEAFNAFENALQANPDYTNARWNIIEILQQQKDNIQAVEHIDYLLKQDEQNAEYRNLAGNIYYHAGQDLCETDRSKAEEYLVKAMSVSTTYKASFSIAAGEYYAKKDYENAVYFNKLAIKHQKPMADLYEVTGMWLSMHLDKKEEAIYYFEQAIHIQPSYHAYFNLGLTSEELGRYYIAAENYVKAIQLKPDHMKAIHQLTQLRINGLI